MRNRREFLKGAATVVATAATVGTAAAKGQSTANKSKLADVAFLPLPLGHVLPTQWLQDQLNVQANGLSGSIETIFPQVGDSIWIGGTNTRSERGPYYLDGLIPLSSVLPANANLQARAKAWVQYVLAHQQPNGLLGPAHTGKNDWWPPMPMLKALMQWYEISGDKTVLTALTRYFTFHANTAAAEPLTTWAKDRWIEEVYVLQWTYDHTGDPNLLALSETLRQQGFDWLALFASNYPYTTKTDRKNRTPERHGVNNGQAIKTAAVQYRLTGNNGQRSAYLAKFQQQLATLDKYHGQPSGIFSCDEHLAGLDPQQGTELCTVAETLFSLEVGLSTFGDAAIADRIEKIAYNALPGLLTEDMWAQQYVGQSNQIFSGTMTEDPYATDPAVSNTYGLAPRDGCCTANYHQAWPKLTASLWMRSAPDNGLVAAVIAPSVVTLPIAGVHVQVTTKTNYPFDGKVRYTVAPGSPVRFPLYVRIPAWAGDTAYTLNGKAAGTGSKGTYVKIDRRWRPGDYVEMNFDMKPRVARGPGKLNYVAIESGPLVFSYPLEGVWTKTSPFYGGTKCADWKVTPARAFNLALDIDEFNAASIRVARREPSATPFASAAPPVTFTVQAKPLPEWPADSKEKNYADAPPTSPVSSASAAQQVTLQPYGSTRLRITAFPSLRS